MIKGVSQVVVHPIVLLSVVDHYNRLASDKRVVGVLLGTNDGGRVEVTNSYAVPFEEDRSNPRIWFLDHNFHEKMWTMQKKVNANEKVIGWYSSGPKIKPADMEINNLFRRYCANPVFVIVDVEPQEVGIPTKSYIAVQEVTEDEKKTEYRFQHIPSVIGALEAEEVGVEHLLRDVKDANISTLGTQVNDKILALRSLKGKLEEMVQYIDCLVSGQIPSINHQIIYQLQDIFNLLPSINSELVDAFQVKTNDMMLNIYVASLLRSITAMHDLINNKMEFQQQEAMEDQSSDNESDEESIFDLEGVDLLIEEEDDE
eukprot:TRINITY_DN52_c0_g1_i1.p1 TRINITY_DN52_c0_g1~~TRINITY_DN52_c0_g1_i1.p1  ORF type:complete len:315 (+),score=69.85 TRINITY_DN52_c0_g1_i1:52-996(+)